MEDIGYFMHSKVKVAVIGGGSWATAIVKMLCENLETVGWYMRSNYALEHIKREEHNPSYLSSVEFKPEQLKLSNDINEIVAYADVVIFAVPSAFIGGELAKLSASLENKLIISAIKGIMPESGKLVGDHFHNVYNIPFENKENAKLVAKNLSSDYIKCTTSDDIIGIEYAATLKNIYAIAAGIAHGLGYGDNFQALLMSNAIREIKRYVKRAHKMKRDINGSAYLGDLLVTGYSVFSRNRMFGNMIGKGYTVKSAQMEMSMIAEGYYAAKSALELNESREKQAKIPIIEAVHCILYKGKDPKKVFKKLTEKLN